MSDNVNKCSLTVKEIYINLLENQVDKNGDRHFKNKRDRIFKHIIPELGHYKISELNSDILERFINSLTKKTYTKGKSEIQHLYSQDSISKIYDSTNEMIFYSRKNGYIDKDPMEFIKKPKSKKIVENKRKDLSKENMQLLDTILNENKMLKLMFYLGAYTGMRPSEVKALHFSDVDYKNKTISVNKALTFKNKDKINVETGENGGRVPILSNMKNVNKSGNVNNAFRKIAVTDKLLNAVKEWQEYIQSDKNLMMQRKQNNTTDFIFTSDDGRLVHQDHYDGKYRRLLKKHGYQRQDFNWYRLRHSYCTELCRQKLAPKLISRLMGDNTIDMVMRVYNSIDNQDVLDSSKEFSNHMDGILGN